MIKNPFLYFTRYYLPNAFFFFAVMPFVSPVPLSTDVQPTSIVLGLLLAFVILLRKQLFLNIQELYFFFFAAGSIFLVSLSSEFVLQHRIGLFSAFLIYYATIRFRDTFDIRILRIAIIIHFFGVLWHFLSPTTFIPVAELLVRTIKVKEMGSRGASGFSPENSFAATLALVHLILLLFFLERSRLSKLNIYLLTTLCFLTILLSKSGSGYVFTVIFVGFYFFSRINIKKFSVAKLAILTFLLVATVFVVRSPVVLESRGGRLVEIILKNPQLVFLDGAIAERIIGIEVGIRSLVRYPLGVGGGGYPSVAKEINADVGLEEKYRTARVETQLEATASSLGKYLTEFGIFFIFLLLIILRKSFEFRLFNMLSVFFAFIFIVASFSIAFPPTYLLLGLSSRRGITKEDTNQGN